MECRCTGRFLWGGLVLTSPQTPPQIPPQNLPPFLSFSFSSFPFSFLIPLAFRGGVRGGAFLPSGEGLGVRLGGSLGRSLGRSFANTSPSASPLYKGVPAHLGRCGGVFVSICIFSTGSLFLSLSSQGIRSRVSVLFSIFPFLSSPLRGS